MSKSLYKERILEHYKEPHHFGSLDNPDVESEQANETCGDELHFQAKIVDGKVEDVSFEGEGCALSIAGASMLTDEIVGEDVSTIKNISDERLFELIGLKKDEVSPMRLKCVLLGRDAVQSMLGDTQ